MKKMIAGLGLAVLVIAIPTLAKDTGVNWPNYKKWTIAQVKPHLVVPANPVADYGVPYLEALRLKLGEVRYYIDDMKNPQMQVTELVIFGKVVGRSLEKKDGPATFQLLVDGKWLTFVQGPAIYLIDAKALFQKGEMKGVILEATAEDGTKLQSRVTP